MQISANYYSISPPRFIAGTKGSYGIEKLEISFSDEWNGLKKKILFYPPSSPAVAVFYEGEPVDIPVEVMSVRGRTRYAIVGYEGEKKLLTVSGEIDVLSALDDTENTAQKPTPGEIAQVLEHMQTAIDVANSIRSDADNGVFDGVDANRWHMGTEISGAEDVYYTLEGAACNDLYFNTETYDIYVSVEDDLWMYVGNVQGAQGEKGEKGDKGDKGDTGDTGPQGEKGENGGFEVVHFSVDVTTGMLTMTVCDATDDVTFSINSNGYLEVTINE